AHTLVIPSILSSSRRRPGSRATAEPRPPPPRRYGMRQKPPRLRRSGEGRSPGQHDRHEQPVLGPGLRRDDGGYGSAAWSSLSTADDDFSRPLPPLSRTCADPVSTTAAVKGSRAPTDGREPQI